MPWPPSQATENNHHTYLIGCIVCFDNFGKDFEWPIKTRTKSVNHGQTITSLNDFAIYYFFGLKPLF